MPSPDLSRRDLTLVECDHCGSDCFNVYRDDKGRPVIACDTCGCEADA